MANSWISALPLSALCLGMSAAQAADTPSPELIARGEYLAIAGDCGACHTEANRPAFSGGHPIASPLGTLYSTNITPSLQAGIGGYSQTQFADAVRLGIRADGSHLYPAMPYTAYAKLTDADMAALYAYFMHGVTPVESQPEKTALPFPFNLRFSMAAWNLLFLDTTPFTPDPQQSAAWNRGAYLVQGLTHCSTCHTPRNVLMAEKGSQALAGASLGTWYAPDITAAGLHDWNRDMLVTYLKTGHASNGATAGGPMLEAIDKSFTRLTPEDRQAIATYLLPERAAAVPTTPVNHHIHGDDTPAALAVLGAGGRIYRDNCAACHGLHGEGLRGLPALAGHPVLDKPTTDNVAMAVLEGVWPEGGQGMPGFAHELTDSQVAEVTNYVAGTFGHSGVTLSADRVGELRQGGAASPLMLLARGGMALAGVIAAVVLFRLWLRRR